MPPSYDADPMPALGELPQAFLNGDARATSITDTGKPSLTIDQAASQIVRGEPGWSAALGQPFTVTYAYRSTADTMPSDTAGFSRFNAAQIAQTELALKAWSDVANIQFVRVGVGITGDIAYSNAATILLGNYSSGQAGAAAFTFLPGQTAFTSPSGDVWVNSTYSYNQAPALGNYGATVLVHELGHAIGLEHPSDYDATADNTLTYAANASYYEDDRQYTVMSYFSETSTGANYRGFYPAAPQLDDIAAAQLEYGANMSTRTGDTVYGFNSNADEPWFVANSSATKLVFAVWDAGGVDTFDFSGYAQNQVIDLRAGNFSNVGGLVGNVAIAKGVTIENAIGGSGDDFIVGNSAGNYIFAGPGNDTVVAGNGPNTILGYDGNDSIQGGAGYDNVNGNRGNDTIDGGAGGGDFLLGGQGNDIIYVHASSNSVNGNLGNDTIYGGAGGDTLRGGQANDSIVGGSGADQLYGDLGDDTLTGGAGADVFHLAPNGGHDLVTDFMPGQDVLELDQAGPYTLAQSGANTVITLTNTGDSITLMGVLASGLPPGSIVLA